MSFLLRNVADPNLEMNCAQAIWPRLVNLGQAYGWQPVGTVLECEENWDGDYKSNGGRLITDEDAARYADALEKAIAHFPTQDSVTKAKWQNRARIWNEPNSDQRFALRYLKDRDAELEVERVQGLINFLRKGAFTLH